MVNSHSRWLAVALLVGLTACSSRPSARPFAEVFPDPAELLTTTDVKGARARLARSEPPRTREHHEQLLELVRGAESLDADHLLLICDAFYGAPVVLRLLRLMKPMLVEAPSGATMEQLVDRFSFDSGRRELIELFADEIRALPEVDRRRLLDAFSFRSGREDAMRLMGL